MKTEEQKWDEINRKQRWYIHWGQSWNLALEMVSAVVVKAKGMETEEATKAIKDWQAWFFQELEKVPEYVPPQTWFDHEAGQEVPNLNPKFSPVKKTRPDYFQAKPGMNCRKCEAKVGDGHWCEGCYVCNTVSNEQVRDQAGDLIKEPEE